MPIIVDQGNGGFKYIEDGRSPDTSANYTYVSAEEFPADLQYMLDRNYDTTAPSQSSAPQAAGSGGSGSGGYSSGGGGSVRSGNQRVVADVLRDTPQAQAQARSVGRAATSSGSLGSATFDSTSTPLVMLTGAGGQNTAWNEYTPEGETAPRVGDNAYLPFVSGAGASVSGGGVPPGGMRSAALGAEPSAWKPFREFGMDEPLTGQAGVMGDVLRGPYNFEPQAMAVDRAALAGDPALERHLLSLRGTGDPTQSPGGYGGAIGDYYDPRVHAQNRAALAGDPLLDQARPWNAYVQPDRLRGQYEEIPRISLVIPSYSER